MKATVLGTGAWGTALAQVLADNGHEVTLWGVEKDQVDDLNLRHVNSRYFGPRVFPASLGATLDLSRALAGTKLIVVAVPTFAVASATTAAAPLIKGRPLVVSVSKGFNPATGGFMSETIRECLPAAKRSEVVTLAGPSFAVEVAARLPTAVTAASVNMADAARVQAAFSNKYFRVYSNADEVGAEYAGAIKNVIALASGCLDGLGYSTNTRAALITRGLAEMARFAISQGGKAETIYGLTGVGDLVLTCSSSESRNYQVGYAIGKSGDAQKVLAENKLTAEGVKSALILHGKAQKARVEMPICESVYRVIYQGENPRTMVYDLMERPLRAEGFGTI